MLLASGAEAPRSREHQRPQPDRGLSSPPYAGIIDAASKRSGSSAVQASAETAPGHVALSAHPGSAQASPRCRSAEWVED
jgi:hypothetical protein